MKALSDRIDNSNGFINSLLKSKHEKFSNPTLSILSNGDRIGNCLFISKEMQKIKKILPAVINNSHPALILGETGVGKSALAEAIHLSSPRSKGPFVRVNCATLKETLIESELFGHEKGAFTGANSKKLGFFEQANGGTLFLDEIGELSPAGQAALLTVMDSSKYRTVGGKEYTTTARIIAATNKDLLSDIDSNFRQDLYERLTVWVITMPPLSSRKEEIISLAEEFLRRHGNGEYRLNRDAEQFLINAEFPGNLRSLENYIKRGISLAESFQGKVITKELLLQVEEMFGNISQASITSINSTKNLNGIKPVVKPEKGFDEQVMEFERNLLEQALKSNGGNIDRAAGTLKLKRRTFYRILQRVNLSKEVKKFAGLGKSRVIDNIRNCDFNSEVKEYQMQLITLYINTYGNRRLVAQQLQVTERKLYRLIESFSDVGY